MNDFSNGTDFLKFVETTIANWAYKPAKDKSIVLDEDKQKVVRLIPGTMKILGRHVLSMIETGDYGEISNIIDTDTGEVKYIKTEKDADVLPFFIMFYVPENAKSALMISQRYKQFGATSIVLDTIKKEFRTKFPHVQMEISSLKSTALSNRFLSSGNLKKITFKCFNPRVLSGFPNIEGLNANEYTLEYSIVSKRGKKIPGSILNLFRKNVDASKTISHLIEIPYYEYNDVAFDLRLNGHYRTLKASDIESLGSFFDISDDVEFGDNRLPTYASIQKIAMSILDDIKESYNGE